MIAASRFEISDFRFQISNLRSEIENAKERKVRTPKGSEPANGGAFEKDFKFQISDLRSGMSLLERRQVQQRIDQPGIDLKFQI